MILIFNTSTEKKQHKFCQILLFNLHSNANLQYVQFYIKTLSFLTTVLKVQNRVPNLELCPPSLCSLPLSCHAF